MIGTIERIPFLIFFLVNNIISGHKNKAVCFPPKKVKAGLTSKQYKAIIISIAFIYYDIKDNK